MVLVFLPIWLVRVHGYEEHTAVTTLGLFGVGAVFGTLLGGWLTDRFHALPVQFFTLLGMALGFVLLERSTDSVAIGALVVAVGLLGQAFRPANDTLLAAVCAPAERTRAFGLHRLAINLGWAIGPVIGGLLSELSWSLLFWADALTCLLAGLILLASSRSLRVLEPVPDPEHEAARGGGPLRDPLFLALVGCMFLAALVFMQFFSTLTVYLSEDVGWSPAEIGALQALNPLLIVVFEMLLLQRLRHAQPLTIVAGGALLLGLGFGLLSLSAATLWIVLCIAILSFGEMLNMPFATAFVANRATAATRGRYMALHGLAFSLALIGAPVLGGQVSRHFGWGALWLSAGGLGLVATLALLVLARAVHAQPAPQR